MTGWRITQHEVTITRVPLFQKNPTVVFRGSTSDLVTLASHFRDPRRPPSPPRLPTSDAICPHPRCTSDAPGMDSPLVGMTSLLIKRRLRSAGAATEFVDRPKIAPLPPVAMIRRRQGRCELPWNASPWRKCRGKPDWNRARPREIPSARTCGPCLRIRSGVPVRRARRAVLPGGGAGEGGTVEEGAAEAAEVEQSFRRAVEGTPMRSSKSMMPGAASHMALTGGWLARKSPP